MTFLRIEIIDCQASQPTMTASIKMLTWIILSLVYVAQQFMVLFKLKKESFVAFSPCLCNPKQLPQHTVPTALNNLPWPIIKRL